MATSSMCAATGAPAGELSMIDTAAGAMSFAAHAFSRQDDAGEMQSAPAWARVPAEFPTPGAQASQPSRGHSPAQLPDGCLPVRETRNMALLGRWTPLDDGMSPCLPGKVVAAMQRRRDLGDRDADAWLGLHARAYGGDPEAQRAFGRVCESGLYRATADVQRAFFWYYRAGLQGNAQARRDAERLMRYTRISSATMAEPALVYPGLWRITAHLSEQWRSASVFELTGDGTAAGCLLGDDAEPYPARPGSAEDATTQAAASSNVLALYRGGWAYDGVGNVLTLIFDASGPDARRWRSDHWQIELLGCGTGSLFGRDRRMVAYTLEHLEPARRET